MRSGTRVRRRSNPGTTCASSDVLSTSRNAASSACGADTHAQTIRAPRRTAGKGRALQDRTVQSVRCPPRRHSRANSVDSRVLPTPASPEISTSCRPVGACPASWFSAGRAPSPCRSVRRPDRHPTPTPAAAGSLSVAAAGVNRRIRSWRAMRRARTTSRQSVENASCALRQRRSKALAAAGGRPAGGAGTASDKMDDPRP